MRKSLSKNGGETSDVIRLRVTAEERERWTTAAGGHGKLSAWIRGVLDRAAKRTARKG